MPETLPTIVALVLFAAAVLAISLDALAVSGHFPRAAAHSQGPGRLLVWGSVAAALACTAVGVLSAWWLIPWQAAIIAGGFAVLSAPLVLQRFSDPFVDGSGALIGFSGAAILCAALLIAMAIAGPA